MFISLGGVDIHDVVLESIAVDSPSLESVAVAVDGVEGIIEDLCYTRTLFYAQAHKGEDAEVGVHHFAVGEYYLCVGSQQTVHLVDEVGIDV